MTIQWYPGHMAKAKREVQEKLKLIDIVFEIVDARVPQSSRNPLLDDLVRDKPRLLLLNKADMADSELTRRWIEYFQEQGIHALAINSRNGEGLDEIVSLSRKMLADKISRMKEKKGYAPGDAGPRCRHP